MDPSFEELRRTIYGSGEEKKRFRQVRHELFLRRFSRLTSRLTCLLILVGSSW